MDDDRSRTVNGRRQRLSFETEADVRHGIGCLGVLGSTSTASSISDIREGRTDDYRECDRGGSRACKGAAEMISVARIDDGTVRRDDTPKVIIRVVRGRASHEMAMTE